MGYRENQSGGTDLAYIAFSTDLKNPRPLQETNVLSCFSKYEDGVRYIVCWKDRDTAVEWLSDRFREDVFGVIPVSIERLEEQLRELTEQEKTPFPHTWRWFEKVEW